MYLKNLFGENYVKNYNFTLSDYSLGRGKQIFKGHHLRLANCQLIVRLGFNLFNVYTLHTFLSVVFLCVMVD